MQTTPKSYSYLPLRRISLRAAVWSILTGVGIILPMLWLLHFLPASWMADHSAFNARAADATGSPLAFLLKAVICYPIIEELVYRGLILQSTRRFLPIWLAVGFTSIFFGATHFGFSITTAIFATACGFYFAWLVLRSRSLLSSMLCHATVNFSAWFIFYPLSNGTAGANAFSSPVWLLMIVASLILFDRGVRILAREFKHADSVAASHRSNVPSAHSILTPTC